MNKFAVVITIVLLSGCMTAMQHKEQVQDNKTDRISVGSVQREIRVGMSGAEVAQVLGSPNIVSSDEQRREVWIYDKIATDTVYSASSGGIAALILFPIGGVLPHYNQSTGASSKSQRTLTIIIKFDKHKKVRDFAYHTSRF